MKPRHARAQARPETGPRSKNSGPELRRGVCEQAAGDVRVGSAEEAVVGVRRQRKALQHRQAPQNEGVVRRHPDTGLRESGCTVDVQLHTESGWRAEI